MNSERTMLAIEYDEFGEPEVLSLRQIPMPKVRRNELLIEVVAAALNPKDLLVRKGKFKMLSGSKFPKGQGYDFAGTIANPGNQTYLPAGTPVYGTVNGMSGRTMAQFLAVKPEEVAKMPANLDFDAAAGLSLVGQTALQALRDLGRTSPGSRVCINGASGGVGTVAIQIAKILGAQVTAVCSASNFDLCHKLGADHLIDYQAQDIRQSGQEFDIFFDVFGNYSLPAIKPLLPPRGMYITTVPKPANLTQQMLTVFAARKAKLVVVKSNREDLNWLRTKTEEGQLTPVVDRVYGPEQIVDANAYLETKRAKGKVIIRIKDLQK